MSLFHTQVTLRGFYFEDSHLTVNLAAGITAEHRGRAMSIGAAPNTYKLASDDDVIVARLETVEDRKVEGQLVGTIAFRFSNLLPIKSGETVAAGDTVVGAGDGFVKAAAVSAPTQNHVAEVLDTYAVVVKI